MRGVAVAGGIGGGAEQPGLITVIAGLVGTVMGSVGLWLANRLMGKAAFQTAINAGFAALTQELQEERNALRRELTEARVHWDAERAQLRGEIGNLTATIEGLKELLRRNGIPVPERRKTHFDPANETPPMMILPPTGRDQT